MGDGNFELNRNFTFFTPSKKFFSEHGKRDFRIVDIF